MHRHFLINSLMCLLTTLRIVYLYLFVYLHLHSYFHLCSHVIVFLVKNGEHPKIAYQLEINIRCFPKTNCAVCKMGKSPLHPPSILLLTLLTVSNVSDRYSCIVPLCVSVYIPLSVSIVLSYLCHGFNDDNRKLIFRVVIMRELFFLHIYSVYTMHVKFYH